MASHTSTLTPMITIEVMPAFVGRNPPYAVRALRVVLAPSLTQSGHWKPTAESRMQSGQMIFSQR